MTAPGSTSWGALIATYRRPDTVRECVRLLLEQSRAPEEILVIAPEADTTTTPEAFESLRPALEARTRFVFAKGPRGLTRQRNFGLPLIRSEVCLFLDDDCFAPPDFAERLIRIFDEDVDRVVGGAAGLPVEGASAQAWWAARCGDEGGARAALGERRQGALARARSAARRSLGRSLARYVGAAFPPEEFSVKHALPAALESPARSAEPWLPGGCTAYRAEVLRAFRFCESFHGYSAAEDVEFSYRVGRHHCLVRCNDAPVYHMQVGSGRPDHAMMTFSTLLNLAYIARTAMPPSPRLRRFVLQHHRRSTRARGLLGLLGRRGLSDWRAARAGVSAASRLLDAPEGSVQQTYEETCAAWSASRGSAAPDVN